MTTDIADNTPVTTPTDTTTTEVLYAGKFKTIEALEEGYKAGFGVHQANQRLQAELDAETAIPDDYTAPADVTIEPDEIAPLKEIAKKSKLSQKAFERVAAEVAARTAAAKQADEAKRKALVASVGADKVAQVTEFVSKQYPPEVAQIVIQNALKDGNTFNALLNQRNSRLDSSTPGISTVGVAPSVPTQNDIINARNASIANPADMNLRTAYINLISARKSG